MADHIITVIKVGFCGLINLIQLVHILYNSNVHAFLMMSDGNMEKYKMCTTYTVHNASSFLV